MRLLRRDFTLLLVLGVACAGFYAATWAFASSNHKLKTRLAAAWYQQGEARLLHGNADAAVVDLRKATVNDHNTLLYVRALAHALGAAGRNSEARELLLQLRENAPDDPETNVDLARIAAKENNLSDAVRYYHNALYGVWTGDDVDFQRQSVRRELIELLIERNAKEQALGEILALAAHLPDSEAARLELGNLFLQVGDIQRALDNFNSVLQRDPHDTTALKGAGTAFFDLGNYRQAERRLAAIAHPDAKSKNLLDVAISVVRSDPLQPHLLLEERSRRVLTDVDQAASALQDCLSAQSSTSGSAQLLSSLQDRLVQQRQLITVKALRDDPDRIYSSLNVIYRAEEVVSRSCGPLSGTDLALLLIAQKSRGVEQ